KRSEPARVAALSVRAEVDDRAERNLGEEPLDFLGPHALVFGGAEEATPSQGAAVPAGVAAQVSEVEGLFEVKVAFVRAGHVSSPSVVIPRPRGVGARRRAGNAGPSRRCALSRARPRG